MNMTSPNPYTKYKPAKERVNRLLVGDEVPNTSSISASLVNYEVLSGIRKVPFSAFSQLGPLRYLSQMDEYRVKSLAEKIDQSGFIDPLIVVEDIEGPYILEGAHRFDALRELGIKAFPALVVLDLESLDI